MEDTHTVLTNLLIECGISKKDLDIMSDDDIKEKIRSMNAYGYEQRANIQRLKRLLTDVASEPIKENE